MIWIHDMMTDGVTFWRRVTLTRVDIYESRFWVCHPLDPIPTTPPLMEDTGQAGHAIIQSGTELFHLLSRTD